MTSPAEQEADARDLVALALASLSGVGPVTIRRLLLTHGSADAAFEAAAPDVAVRQRALDSARRVRARCADREIELLAAGDDRYPQELFALEDPPAVLYAKGRIELTRAPSVALVGARRATSYGLHVADTFARRLAQKGVTVVSGLAMGVDAAAHAAALDAHGGTIAVQGTGVDVPYPRAHMALHARLSREGLVLSELPPGRAAHPGAFPRRNRLIAALADLIVVVEAGSKSGSLITAQIGGTLGRMVAAVPGPIDRESSAGANTLLRDGAHVVASVDDVLALLALTPRGRSATPLPHESVGDAQLCANFQDDPSISFPDGSPESAVLRVLSFGAQGPDELVRACGISPREVGVALANLVLMEAVQVDSSGLAHRRPGHRLLAAT